MGDEDSGKYTKLGRDKRSNPTNVFANLSPPKDFRNCVYIAFIFFGAGFLLPYNSFVLAMDYFKIRYPGTYVVFDVSLVYILFAFITVFANNFCVEMLSHTKRIQTGYCIAVVTIVFVDAYEIYWEMFDTATSYTVNLIAVALLAIGCTIQQSSFYGFASMLPPEYTQAVMVGESASGVFVSAIRVLTRFFLRDIHLSTTYFFGVSSMSLIFCNILYYAVKKTDFVQFHITLCNREKTRITLEPTEDAGLIETNEPHYGVLKLQMSPRNNETPPPTGTPPLSFANPVYDFGAPAPSYKVEEVVIRGRSSVNTGRGISGFRRGLLARWEITKAIYPYMIAMSLAYFTTLCIYPGIVSEIANCTFGSWMPVMTMAFFNASDLVGKIIASSSSYWNGTKLLQCCILRIFMIPVVMFCIIPRDDPIFSEAIFPFTFVTILGISNGILGSVPIIQAPTKVANYHREITGNMMTLLYNVGLTAGSIVAYLLEYLIPPIEDHPCAPLFNDLPKIPHIHVHNDTSSTASTSALITSIVSTLNTLTAVANVTTNPG